MRVLLFESLPAESFQGSKTSFYIFLHVMNKHLGKLHLEKLLSVSLLSPFAHTPPISGKAPC